MSVSAGVSTIQIFTDRIFLSYYYLVFYATPVPDGYFVVGVTVISVYALAYIDVFVAQY